MKLGEAMEALERLGSEETAATMRKHGVGAPLYGVRHGDLDALAKELGTDQALASRLWATGHHDARMLATRIADARALSSADLDRWARDLDSYVLTDAFVKTVARSRHARAKMKKWTRRKSEWVGRAGWRLLAHLAMSDGAIGDDALDAWLASIVSRIHDAKNRQRDAMLDAVAAIGLRGGRLEAEALRAVELIGPVEVDHGPTRCRTTDPAKMIAAAKARRARRR